MDLIVSVIMPAYNAEKFIGKAIDSSYKTKNAWVNHYCNLNFEVKKSGFQKIKLFISLLENVLKIRPDISSGSRKDRMQFAKFSLPLDENLKAVIFNFTE